MPVQEEPGNVVVRTWVLEDIDDAREFQDAMFELGFDSSVRRITTVPAGGILMQVDIPDKPRDPIVIDHFGTVIRSISLGTTLISLEKLPDGDA